MALNNHKCTKYETKNLVAEALAVITKAIMNNQLYSFGGKVRVKDGKGSIGDKAIGIIAAIVMIAWARKFRQCLVEVQSVNEVLKIYVDDIKGTFTPTPKGVKYSSGKLCPQLRLA